MQMQADHKYEQDLGQHIKEKVKAIDKLTDLDNTKRMLARGYVALENLTAANSAKQKNEIMQDLAKFDTLKTLGENN